ncbi:MAG TPA: hypothetical protein VKX45_13680 [Bryobacteraceae bacterium]|jgi:hypothetical protein|nr:hypothetical protein [Bryobacteraceae bacterium]
MRKFMVVAALAISSLTVLSAKSYEIILSGPTKAGNLQLKPGQYTLKVNGDKAVFTDINSSKSFTTPVKVQTTDKKFDDTRVQSTKDGEVDKIEEIDLGGSKTKLGF